MAQAGGGHFEAKHGLGRQKYVIKQLGLAVSLRQVENDKEMLRRGIPMLIFAGCVAREEAPSKS